MTERVIGVDFGSSTSVIRVKSYQDGEPVGGTLDTKAVAFHMGMTMTPTLVQKAKAELYFGFDAAVQRRNAERFSAFKADLENPDESVRQRARDATALFLKFLAGAYRSQSDGGHFGNAQETERTIISYPVKWSEESKAFMRNAAQEAGFSNVEGMDEARAAIQAVTVQNADTLQNKGVFRSGQPVNILLMDMGAGTTDLVLCRHTPGIGAETEILSVYPKSGSVLFGGGEADALLRDYIRERLPEEFTDIVLKLCGAETFKTWKETIVSPALQKNESVSSCAPVESILDILGAEPEPFHLDRQEFETYAEAYLKQFPELVAGCVREAGLSGGDVDLVILTGGHSQWYFVKEMLSGKMERFGKIGLAKVEAEPSRMISLALPQETVALGLAYTPLANVIIPPAPKPALRIPVEEEPAHDVLCAFHNWNDDPLTVGDDWIELPVSMFGQTSIRLGQKFALYMEDTDGEAFDILPVCAIQYDGRQVPAVTKSQEDDKRYIPLRVRFRIDDGKKAATEQYQHIGWLISAPVTEKSYSTALFWFTRTVEYVWEKETSDCLTESDKDSISKAFIVLAQDKTEDAVVCRRISGELDADKTLYVYTMAGRQIPLNWTKAIQNLHECTFAATGKRIAPGNVISDCRLPDGLTFSCEIDPKIAWKCYVRVVKAAWSGMFVIEQGK